MVKIIWKRESGQARLQCLERPPAALPCPQSLRASVAGGCAAFRAGSAGGQATIEYAIVTGVLIALVAIMGLFLTTFGDYGERILEIIASDYP